MVRQAIMKKMFFIILTIFLFHCSNDRTEFVGTYKSNPKQIFDFDEPMTEKQKEVLTRLSWKLIVTEDEFVFYTGEKGPLKMRYFIEGKCIVGKDDDSGDEFYFPIYFKDRNTAYGGGQTLIRVKDE